MKGIYFIFFNWILGKQDGLRIGKMTIIKQAVRAIYPSNA